MSMSSLSFMWACTVSMSVDDTLGGAIVSSWLFVLVQTMLTIEGTVNSV